MPEDLQVCGFLLYSITKFTKLGNYIHHFYALVFKCVYAIFYASLELACFDLNWHCIISQTEAILPFSTSPH